jgi:predicted PurR-regulated permease PerM
MSDEPSSDEPIEPPQTEDDVGAAARLLSKVPAVAGLPGPAVALIGVAITAFAMLILLDVAGLVLGVLYDGLGDFLTVLLVSVVVAYLLDPIIDRFETRGWNRTRAIVLSLGIFLVGLALTLLLLIPYVVTELADLGSSMEGWAGNLGGQLAGVEGWLQDILDDPEFTLGWANMTEELPQLLDKLPAGALDPIGGVAEWAVGWFGGLLGFVVHWALFPIFTFFFLRDFDRMKGTMFEMTPFRWRRPLLDHYVAIDKKIAQFLRGQFTLCCILAVLYATGLALFTDVPLGVLIGVTSGLLFIIPYFGTFFGIALGSILAFTEFGLSWEIVKVWVVFGAVQGVEGAFLTPKIVGDSVGLHPLVVMLSLVIGANLFGFLGILLAVPFAAGLQVVLSTLIERYKKTPWYRRDQEGAPTSDDLP